MTEPTIIDSDAPKPEAHDVHLGEPETIATVTRNQLIALLAEAWHRGASFGLAPKEHVPSVYSALAKADTAQIADTWMGAWRKQGNPPVPVVRLSADGDRLHD